ncbi:MAG TPA: Mut7-C RNAse domain-containing protein [Gammaproteobacteria bacterium]
MTDRTTRDPHGPIRRLAEFRFYAELNDFLKAAQRGRAFTHTFAGNPSVKDTIEALGVPHTEVDLILVNGRSVGFGHRLEGGERVAVYPMFERLDVSRATRLRPKPLRVPRFVLDVHLGTLARYLRLVGFDAVWRNDLSDEEIIESSVRERRVILTRDRGILRNGRVTHGYRLRSTDPLEQLEEVIRALQLGEQLEPFTRCLECNGEIAPVTAKDASPSVPERVRAATDESHRCRECGRVYRAGSHQRFP